MVERAYRLGFIPLLTSEYTKVDMVFIPAPFVKCVIIKSSSDIVKASKNPELTPGNISGNTN